VSGLLVRHMPLALMKFADRGPIKFPRSKRIDPRRAVPIPSFDRVAITSVVTLANLWSGSDQQNAL
jgi:hypothetical protein